MVYILRSVCERANSVKHYYYAFLFSASLGSIFMVTIYLEAIFCSKSCSKKALLIFLELLTNCFLVRYFATEHNVSIKSNLLHFICTGRQKLRYYHKITHTQSKLMTGPLVWAQISTNMAWIDLIKSNNKFFHMQTFHTWLIAHYNLAVCRFLWLAMHLPSITFMGSEKWIFTLLVLQSWLVHVWRNS